LSLGTVTFDELDVMIQLKTVRVGKDYRCTDCEYETKMKCNLEKHIEAKHISPGVACQFCNKTCPTRHALRMHLSRNHNALPMQFPWTNRINIKKNYNSFSNSECNKW